jgi:DNA-binding FadR family transcriptional regulator
MATPPQIARRPAALRSTPVSLAPVPSPGSRAQIVIHALRTEIEKGTWPVGSRIPTEHGLAEALCVSRNTVREAVRALVHAGFLETRQGAGTYVLTTRNPRGLLDSLDGASVRHVFEVQLALDVQAARLAAERRTAADLRRLKAALRRRDEAEENDSADFAEVDSRFHETIVAMSGNPVMVELYRALSDRMRRGLRVLWATGPIPGEATAVEHGALVDAIAARDVDRAGRAAERIIRPVLDVLAG